MYQKLKWKKNICQCALIPRDGLMRRKCSKRGRYWEIHLQHLRDFLKPARFLEGKARGKSLGGAQKHADIHLLNSPIALINDLPAST